MIQNDQAGPTGFSIDLWQAIAARLQVKSRLTMQPDLLGMLKTIETGQADLAIAAVTITADRETRMDFSHPYFRSGLQIMVPTSDAGMIAKARSVLSGMFASASFRLVLMAMLVLVAAHVIWLIERRKNPEFTRSYPMGLWDGIYWTMVTISSVGYGDKTPKSHMGRVVAVVLIVFGYVAFAGFTATISSSMTVSKLQGDIKGPEDLSGRRVATVRGSTSQNYLLHLPAVQIMDFTSIDQAYTALQSGDAEAVVYDYPVLSYHLRSAAQAKMRLVGPVFQHEVYGIVFPTGSSFIVDGIHSGGHFRLDRRVDMHGFVGVEHTRSRVIKDRNIQLALGFCND